MPASTKRVKGSSTTISKKKLKQAVKQVTISLAETKAATHALCTAFPILASWSFQSCLAGTPLGGGAAYQINQGVDFNTRVGDVIKLKRIDFTVQITPVAPSVELNGTVCRVIVYHNKQAGGALPTQAQMFETAGAQTNVVYNLRNQLFRNRLTILKDFTHQMVRTSQDGVGGNASAGPDTIMQFSIYPKQIINYSSGTGTLPAILKHDYGIGVCADGASCCVISVACQVVYVDN